MLRWLLVLFCVLAGLNHFRDPSTYLAMMPGALPVPLGLVYVSGAAEIAGGLGLVPRRTRRLAAWGLIALFVAVFPANINMAIHHLPLGGKVVPAWMLWARLPLQGVLVLWAYWFTRPDGRPVVAAGPV
jgi:uncharacterized membrane protein